MPLLDLRLPGEKTLSSFYDSIAAMTEMLPCPRFNIVVGSDINVTTFDEHCRVDFPFVSHKLRVCFKGIGRVTVVDQPGLLVPTQEQEYRDQGVRVFEVARRTGRGDAISCLQHGMVGKMRTEREVLKPSLHALKDAPAF
ncbi:Eukaryotic translation initiation factor 6, partial [Dissostichus eleginoides]